MFLNNLVGVSQAEIDQYAAFDDPAQGLEVVQKIEGDDYTLEYWLGGQKVVAQSYKLGVYREGQHEDIKFKVMIFRFFSHFHHFVL